MFEKTEGTTERNNRTRNIIWNNPPFWKDIKNIAKYFLYLLDNHFGANYLYHKIFKRNNVKVSCSCSKNRKTIIKSHNKSISDFKGERTRGNWNCRNKTKCPWDDKCFTNKIVCSVKVKIGNVNPEQTTGIYIGTTGIEFRTSCNNLRNRSNQKTLNYRKMFGVSKIKLKFFSVR